MTSATSPKKVCQGYEPIPGYVLEERIGQGGFGEVWRSTAPGGLHKAIKFVFGSHQQNRATRELRSLERIKGVHHPFLLTLERFEIIDEQLVIITELAEGSLEDVYKIHRESGSCGIPRETLNSHLHDTADGLDYLHQSYQLQHLDIKPGNLLMIGGHVKVADFGLLKDLREADCSIVGGLTPIYAPPELFDGRPSMHSDQYSLAVMYQELLTGTRPFSGRTIAQLATQHVHSAPNLEPLPPSDRPIIARALEKNPQRRFPSCRAFIEALRNPKAGSFQNRLLGKKAGGDGQSIDHSQEQEASVEDLPQLDSQGKARSGASARTPSVQHALVIGLGGCGAECIRELRRRVVSLDQDSPLQLHSVAIDTDMSTLHSMRLAEASERVPKCNVIYTPLRSASEYRDMGTARLKTISRRWIYNVPRSGSTEGMRPLGRLALVDHGDMVQTKLRDSIDQLAQSAGDQTPSIYVVSSIAGGTGSGMYIDVVHMLRHLLDQAGLEACRILSMLSSATFQADASKPLAMHDTQAAVGEIEHFMRVENGYPGDVGAGWESVPAARTPLRDVYLIANPSRDRLAPSPVQSVTEYIWADATGCGDLLAAARRENKPKDQSISVPAFRSVGVVPLGGSHRLEKQVLTPALVRQLMTRWLGVPSKSRQAGPSVAARLARRIGLVPQQIMDGIKEHFGDQYRDAIVPAHPDGLAVAIDTWMNENMVSGQFDGTAAGWTNNLYREVSLCLSDGRADVTTLFEAVKQIEDQCVHWAKEFRHTPSRILLGNAPVPTDISSPLIRNRIAAIEIEQFIESVRFLKERLERFAAILAVAIVESKNDQSNDKPWKTMPPSVQARFESMLDRMHNFLVGENLVRPMNDMGANVDAKSMLTKLHEATMPLVLELVEACSEDMARNREKLSEIEPDTTERAATISFNRTEGTAPLPTCGEAGLDDGPISIEEAVDAAKPALLSLGGLQRLLLVVGNEIERSQIEPEVRAFHSGALTVAVIPGCDPKLIHEAQGIELKDILSRLSVLNGDQSQVTSRLASRVDVDW